MFEYNEVKQLILPIALIIGGVIFGIIFDKLILMKLKRISVWTKWKGDEIIIESLHNKAIIWFTLGGIYIALPHVPITPSLLSIFQKILVILIILSITFVLSKMADGFVTLYSKKLEGILPPTTIFNNLTKLFIFLISLLIILQYLGISIVPILTALGVAGLAVALALQDSLSNLFSGLQIILARKIKPGDYIKLDSGEEGYITDVTWRNTTVRSLPNNIIVIPNSKLAGAIITNYNLPEKEMSVYVDVGVSYDSELKKVERVTIEEAKAVLKEIEGGVSEFEPFIRYHTFADFSIKFTVILRVKEFVNQYLIKHEFVKRLHERYNKEGIKIPFPIRTVYMKEEKS